MIPQIESEAEKSNIKTLVWCHTETPSRQCYQRLFLTKERKCSTETETDNYKKMNT